MQKLINVPRIEGLSSPSDTVVNLRTALISVQQRGKCQWKEASRLPRDNAQRTHSSVYFNNSRRNIYHPHFTSYNLTLNNVRKA